MNEEQKKQHQLDNEAAFQAQIALEKSSSGSFRDELWVMAQMIKVGKSSPFYSWTNFMEF